MFRSNICQFYFFCSWFCIFFPIGYFKSKFPFMAHFIKPSERAVIKYKLHRMEDIKLCIKNNKENIDESTKKIHELQTELLKLKW